MFTNYHVVGLQRSGTNWIHRLMEHNFPDIPCYSNQAHWKHLTPLGINPDWVENRHGKEQKAFGYFPDAFDLQNLELENQSILFIGTHKTLDVWKASIRRRKVDFIQTHNHPDKGAAKHLMEASLNCVWNSWESWRQDSMSKPNFYYRDYQDWFENWNIYLRDIQNITGWKPSTAKWENVDKHTVPFSKHFNPNFYVKGDKNVV